MTRTAVLALAFVVAGALLGWGTGALRRAFIRSFFSDGPSAPAPLLSQPSGRMPAVAPAGRVRVLLIDGLSSDSAATLPRLNDFCGRGLDVTVDVGFPTVSLPVQSVLWTGRTQQQSGRPYRVAALPSPPPGALPTLLPGSPAVAEEQGFIAGSFGFVLRTPKPEAFAAEAEALVAGSERLGFVHVLRVDKAGHKEGKVSVRYAEAALWSDGLLGRLLAAGPPSPDLRWLVLSDHGHRPAGGHGGAERELRLVRACLSGLPAETAPAPLHLADVSRVLFEWLSVPLPEGAVGRPLAHARAHPDLGATVPRASPGRLVAAIVALVLCWLLAARLLAGSPRSTAGLWLLLAWVPLAYLSAVVLRGLPTLSNPMIYPPLGRDMMYVASPGLLLLALGALLSCRRAPGRPALTALAAWALVVGPAVAALLAAGAHLTPFGGGPPLLPLVSAHASFFLALSAASAPVLGLASTLGWLSASTSFPWPPWRPWRSSLPQSPGTPPPTWPA